ncbi:hypothetical protein GCM10011383_17700 [Hymenobacter cavernae]|uniref:Uncharacterized protein n=1 Tax=Hymenobacter cavernae TaxID=2044852 RepID=A0ABQ1U1K6_9BACT|nr:hypothetical protein GCM10011383_17700 [Hymenobacter cavernae]
MVQIHAVRVVLGQKAGSAALAAVKLNGDQSELSTTQQTIFWLVDQTDYQDAEIEETALNSRRQPPSRQIPTL